MPNRSPPRRQVAVPFRIHVLDGSSSLPLLRTEELPAVSTALTTAGRVLIVIGNDSGTVEFFSRPEWIPAGFRLDR